ncbi:uncharacterized protein PHACADRAFT_26773 [Phanerochaete carnosa HHB-10118-sp]|uniref:THUMP domain-containing protein n=1 Tax=Phanerochaete carnosa (strain HHB-10118-sp) TaxID=650164 RepID=K5W2Z8_PHACS|nr:uncharacterized protein PHACADRAFT_26773 [Phanerochaete carnosa HHB-10118-sp]EKM58253.1 hypothetical protein PHACADRAFT_26773 [Phanerochaete carnosa HHB-10118-sp]
MSIEGPGVWVTCIRGKEKQAVGELYDLFEQLASETWPSEGEAQAQDASDEDKDDDDDDDIERQIAKEMSGMKRPKKETRFASCQTSTPCFVALSCKPPVDPVQLVTRYIAGVVESGVTRTRAVQRLTPVSATCITNLQEITALCSKLLAPFLADGKTFTVCPTLFDSLNQYKIELRMRNHNTLTRLKIIEEVAKCVPGICKVDLESPEVFILIEIFKSVCGIGIVRDYYRLQKFNVMEIVKTEEQAFKDNEGRMKTSAGPRSKQAETLVPALPVERS